MPLPRMTTRRWMIAVAVVGGVVGTLRCRADRLEALHQIHHAQCQSILADGEGTYCGHEGHRVRWFHNPGWIEFTVREYAVYDWHAGLSRKYQSAARRPWLPVPPDPPEPD